MLVGRKIKWDVAKEVILGDAEAGKLMTDSEEIQSRLLGALSSWESLVRRNVAVCAEGICHPAPDARPLSHHNPDWYLPCT